MKINIQPYLDIIKIRISILASISAATGYILSGGKLFPGIWIPTVGIFLLAGSSCAINQIQDREIDAKMNRTKNRPLPSGRMDLMTAWIYSLVLFILGSFILYFGGNLTTLVLGWFALIWYNGIYMMLKRISSLAVIPGALIGAIPPVLGWAASGKSIWDPTILSVGFLFFIWQIPHFWLLLMNYKKDYEQAGLPSMTRIFSYHELGRITFIWIMATAVTGILIPLYGQFYPVPTNYLLIIISIWMVGSSINLLFLSESDYSFMKVFRNINIYILLTMLVLSIGKYLGYNHQHIAFLLER